MLISLLSFRFLNLEKEDHGHQCLSLLHALSAFSHASSFSLLLRHTLTDTPCMHAIWIHMWPSPSQATYTNMPALLAQSGSHVYSCLPHATSDTPQTYFASSSISHYPYTQLSHTIPTHAYVLEIPSRTSYAHTLQQRPVSFPLKAFHTSMDTIPAHHIPPPFQTHHTHFLPHRTHTHTHHAHMYTITCLISFHDHLAQALTPATPHTELILQASSYHPHISRQETPPNPCQNSKPTSWINHEGDPDIKGWESWREPPWGHSSIPGGQVSLGHRDEVEQGRDGQALLAQHFWVLQTQPRAPRVAVAAHLLPLSPAPHPFAYNCWPFVPGSGKVSWATNRLGSMALFPPGADRPRTPREDIGFCFKTEPSC